MPVGLLAAAILVVNNVRDVETDRRAGKRTLAVRLGRERAVGVFALMLLLAYAVVPVISVLSELDEWMLLALASIPLAASLPRTLAQRTRRADPQQAAGRHRPAARRLLRPARGRPRPLVVKRDLYVLSLPFREPFVTATGVISERRIILLRLEDDDGAVGWGEAAPFEPYDGISVERVEAVLRARSREELRPAEAAVEMALLDLDARREDRPLGEPGAIAIPVNLTLSAGPADEVAAHAKDGVRAGFQCFKLKVGRADDDERVARRPRGHRPWPALRLDANGVWSVDEAIDRITALEPNDLELVEQPCAHAARARRAAQGSPRRSRPTSRSREPTTCAPPPRRARVTRST